MSSLETFWLGGRERLNTSILDGIVELTDYQIAVVPYSAVYTEGDWHAVDVYNGQRGVWIDSTTTTGTYSAGIFRVFGRAGGGAPNERAIVDLGYVEIRSR